MALQAHLQGVGPAVVTPCYRWQLGSTALRKQTLPPLCECHTSKRRSSEASLVQETLKTGKMSTPLQKPVDIVHELREETILLVTSTEQVEGGDQLLEDTCNTLRTPPPPCSDTITQLL